MYSIILLYFSGKILIDQKIGVSQKPNCTVIATTCPKSLKNTTTELVSQEIPKTKKICTDRLFISEMNTLTRNRIKKTSMKLTDILDFFELKIDPSKLHYAYYDVEILKIVFFNIVDYFNKKY